jgi:hypothetical protein
MNFLFFWEYLSPNNTYFVFNFLGLYAKTANKYRMKYEKKKETKAKKKKKKNEIGQ